MRVGVAWSRVVMCTVLLTMAVVPGASAQSAEPGATGVLVGQFTAHLRGTQTEHYSSLLNVSFDGDGKACKPGLKSHSTDQRMTIESEPVEVDVLRLPPGTPGWDGQDYVLVPRGMDAEMVTWSAPANDPFLAPVLFELPVTVTIDKTYADPATGDGPSEPLPFVVACTGGDGPGGSTPPLDCGERTFTSAMAIRQPEVNAALATASDSVFGAEPTELYQNCPTSIDAVPGGFVLADEFPAHTGGSLPTIEQLLDPNLDAVDIIGQATAGEEDTGYLSSQTLDWTLTLCRPGATAPRC